MALSAWLQIIHCCILCAFTIPEVITLVLHPAFRRAAVTVGFRNFPQFDSVAPPGIAPGRLGLAFYVPILTLLYAPACVHAAVATCLSHSYSRRLPALG